MSWLNSKGLKPTAIEITDIEPGDHISRGVFSEPLEVKKNDTMWVRNRTEWLAIVTLTDGTVITGHIGDQLVLWQ